MTTSPETKYEDLISQAILICQGIQDYLDDDSIDEVEKETFREHMRRACYK